LLQVWRLRTGGVLVFADVHLIVSPGERVIAKASEGRG